MTHHCKKMHSSSEEPLLLTQSCKTTGTRPNISHQDNCFNIEGDEVGFHDCPLPVVQLGLVVQGMISTLDVQTLIDSGATLNLMSQEFIKQLLATQGEHVRRALGACKISELPTVRVASGQRVKSIGCVDLQLQLRPKTISEAVRFFIFPDLPVQAIIGNATNSFWKPTYHGKAKLGKSLLRDSHKESRSPGNPLHLTGEHRSIYWQTENLLYPRGPTAKFLSLTLSKIKTCMQYMAISDSFHHEGLLPRAWLHME